MSLSFEKAFKMGDAFKVSPIFYFLEKNHADKKSYQLYFVFYFPI